MSQIESEDGVLYRESPPMFKNSPIGFVLSVILIAAFGLGIVILLYWYILTRSQRLTITEGFMLYEEGILSKRRTEVKRDHVRTVRVFQTFWQRVFGTGDAEIFTAGDQPELTVKGMPRPYDIRDLLR